MCKYLFNHSVKVASSSGTTQMDFSELSINLAAQNELEC